MFFLDTNLISFDQVNQIIKIKIKLIKFYKINILY
jgi:hypothetical protein